MLFITIFKILLNFLKNFSNSATKILIEQRKFTKFIDFIKVFCKDAIYLNKINLMRLLNKDNWNYIK